MKAVDRWIAPIRADHSRGDVPTSLITPMATYEMNLEPQTIGGDGQFAGGEFHICIREIARLKGDVCEGVGLRWRSPGLDRSSY